MSGKTRIEWATDVWNPTVGCTPVTEGCRNCYARRMFNRFYQDHKFDQIKIHEERLSLPEKWNKPRRIFVDSMSDLFHEDVPSEIIGRVWYTMAHEHRHQFIVLTKRPKRMRAWVNQFLKECLSGVFTNIWLGVSISSNQDLWMVHELLNTPAAIRIVSVEPMLGAVDLEPYLTPALSTSGEGECLDWVICGGESGPNARPMHPDWARALRDQCQAAHVPFYFKQWGEWYPTAEQYGDDDFMDKLNFGTHCICLGNQGTKFMEEWGDRERYWCGFQPDPAQNPWFMERVGKKKAGRLIDGKEWSEIPLVKEE